MKKITLLFVAAIMLSSINLYAIVDYTLDLSPAIKSPKMFSVGYALSYSEYNGIFSDGTLQYGDAGNLDLTFISSRLSMTPYFEYRPLAFLEVGLSCPFSYSKNEEYNSLVYTTAITKDWTFDSIHSHIKVSVIDWLISLGFRMDFNYNLSNTFGKQGNLDIYSKMFVAIVPKVIPLNILLNYQQGVDANNLNYGTAQAALEFITSHILTIYLGANYSFPYTDENNTSALEAFAKVSVFFDDYFSGNVSYSKIFYGENVGNNATFMINLSYHF